VADREQDRLTMKSLNYGDIAAVLRDSRPDPSNHEEYEAWLRSVTEFAREMEVQDLIGFNPRVFMYKAGVEEVKHLED